MHYQREQYFSSFDEFNSFPNGWDTEFSATSSGSYRSALKQSVIPGLFVNTAWLDSPTLQQASTPSGMRTFALPLHQPGPYCWRGLAVGARTLMIFPSDRELFSMMGGDSEVTTLSVDQRFVDECLLSWDVNPEDVFGRPRTTDLSEQEYAKLLRNLDLVTEFMLKYGDHEQCPELSRGMQEYLVEEMLRPQLASLATGQVGISFAARRVKAAADYILCNLDKPLTVEEVCKHIACSRRSLEQCFRKAAGTSPKQFIQIMRFRQCHKALLAAGPDDTVSAIAREHGFWHMGQFARSYSAMFGERPSQTLEQKPKSASGVFPGAGAA